MLHGQAVARACLELKQQGFRPDIVMGHPGWGETLFIKDVYPDVPLVNYGEFFYHSFGADVNFDPEDPTDIDAVCGLRARNAHLLAALTTADRILCPTRWQKALHPAAFHDRISVVFDGVDTEVVRPGPASFVLPDGRTLTRDDEVVTYVARSLEPLRGFRILMRAVPRLCALRPRAQIVIVGGDQRGYGAAPPEGMTWREALSKEVAYDPARVHFCGIIDYARYLDLLRISSAHVYLTYPFVMSWSLVEAMAAECLVIGSRTAPVEEVIEDRCNGLLVDFFSHDLLAETVAAALAEPRRFDGLRRRARESILDGYSVAACLPRQRAILHELAGHELARVASYAPVAPAA